MGRGPKLVTRLWLGMVSLAVQSREDRPPKHKVVELGLLKAF